MFNRASILVRYGLFVVGLTVCAASVATAAGPSPALINFVNNPQTVSLTGSGQFMVLSADRTHLVNTFTEPAGPYLGRHGTGFKRPALQRLRCRDLFGQPGGKAYERYLGLVHRHHSA